MMIRRAVLMLSMILGFTSPIWAGDMTWTSGTGGGTVTITSVSDTNANTECAGTTTYLDGEGACDTLDGLEDFETATDDSIPVGNATTFDIKTLPPCSGATTDKLLYNIATNTFSCGTDQTGAAGEDSIGATELDDGTDTATIDDVVMVDNADTTQFIYIDVPDCDDPSHLNYDVTSQAFSCGTTDDDLPDADEITESMLKEVGATPADEDILSYEVTTGDFEWHTPAELITAGTEISWTGTTLNVTSHTTDTGPSPDCAGTTTFQDGDGNCVTENAGTDITADLEEEAHATEHSDGAADEIVVTNLASACTDTQTLGGTSVAGGVECQTDDDIPDAGDYTNLTGGTAITNSPTGTINLDTAASPAITGDWDFSGGGIEIQNGITPPACTEGQLFFDTNATSGQRLMGCEGTTFVVQGDGGGGGGGDSVKIDGVDVVDPDFVSTGDIDFIDTTNTITANINADIVDGTELADNITVDTLTIGDGVPTNYTQISATGAITQAGSATLTLQDGSDLIITANDNAGPFMSSTQTDTIGSGAGFTWTLDASAGTDSVMTFGDGTINISTGALQEAGQNVVTDATDVTDVDGTGLVISAGVLQMATSEAHTLTWGDGTQTSWTQAYDITGAATDPVWTFSDGIVNLSTGTLQAGGTAVSTGTHTTDTGPSPDCTGTTTFQNGEGGCVTENAGTDITADLEEETHAADHAGRSLTAATDSLAADAELYTDTKCIYFEDPVAADDFKTIWVANIPATITGISCESDQTVNMDLQVDDGTPTGVNGSDIACTSTWGEDTSLAGDTGLAANDRLDLAIASVSGTPTWVSICWELTYDD